MKCLGPCQRIVVPVRKGRCAECAALLERERVRLRDRPWYGGDWRTVSRETIKQHVTQYGYRCTRCDRADPNTNPLTVDHVAPRRRDNGLQVLCRLCNSSKGAK